MDLEIELLLGFLDEAFDRPRAWHGPTLLATIRGLSADEAAWRPSSERHSVWELVLHCAFWKSTVRRRLAPFPGERFPRPGRDWPRLPASLDEKAWKADVRLLKDEHLRLRETIAGLSAKSLHEVPEGQKRPRIVNVRGIAAHDLYHAGQIRLIRLLGEEARG